MTRSSTWLKVVVLYYVVCLKSISTMSIESSLSVRVDALRQRLQQLVLSPSSSAIADCEGDIGSKSSGVILIDGDNVRGKTKFKLSKEELTARVQKWTASSSLSGLVVLMFDHGSTHSSIFIPDCSLAVVFSGPGRTADDVITRDVGWFQARHQDVVVVTEDNGLKRRCRTSVKGRASARGRQSKSKSKKAETHGRPVHDLTFVGSPLFAEMVLTMWPLEVPAGQEGGDVGAPPDTDTAAAVGAAVTNPVFGASPSGTLESVGSKYNPEVVLMRKEVDLRRQLSGIQTALAKCNRKAAVKLRLREAEIKKRLTLVAAAVRDVQAASDVCDREGQGAADTAVAAEDAVSGGGGRGLPDGGVQSPSRGACTEGSIDIDTPVDAARQGGGEGEGDEEACGPGVVDRGSALLAKLLARGRPPGTVEETWERIILAEQLRHRLHQQHGDCLLAPLSPSPVPGSTASLSQQYVQYINSNFAAVAKSVASVVKVD